MSIVCKIQHLTFWSDTLKKLKFIEEILTHFKCFSPVGLSKGRKSSRNLTKAQTSKRNTKASDLTAEGRGRGWLESSSKILTREARKLRKLTFQLPGKVMVVFERFPGRFYEQNLSFLPPN